MENFWPSEQKAVSGHGLENPHFKLAKLIQPPPAVKASSAEGASYSLQQTVATREGPRHREEECAEQLCPLLMGQIRLLSGVRRNFPR
jgi:hypothetical protein